MSKGNYSGGLRDALIALSFYRARNQRAAQFKHPSKRSHAAQTVSRRIERVRAARRHIAAARAAGFRGSIIAAIGIEEETI